ncbi:HD domain-containing protein [Zunongwangia sp. F363]|uniref:HD domain-containing protein n=1 Tax=Autumnicola tepida TaxID=3075595 RepID=A0ABU3CEM0_9FLAO|nr:HD domain-containing protein [Zunongwangia sp. F363]MDT0644793.1 HD domain-containing protein [Zunongwangia sp. F363]
MEEEALEYARRAHGDQQRKYTKEAYIEHPKRVAEIVRTVPHSSEMICAAYLHDVVEDTPVSIQDIQRKFGRKIAGLVEELTDVFTKEKYPHLNRKKRKQREVERQAKISVEAKTIKLADVIDNTHDILENDPGFARRYVPEMIALTEALQGGNFQLLMRACYEVECARKVLQQKR